MARLRGWAPRGERIKAAVPHGHWQTLTFLAALLEELNDRPMRHIGKSRWQLFEEIEREAMAPLPSEPFEYAEWKTAKVHPDYHVEVDKTFYSVPHRLIGLRVDVRLTYRADEIFQDYTRVASHVRRSQRGGHITVNEHMPKAHQRYANRTPASLITMARSFAACSAVPKGVPFARRSGVPIRCRLTMISQFAARPTVNPPHAKIV